MKPKIINSSHEIYIIQNESDIIDCIKPNCFIQCISQNTCDDMIINAINIYNLNILCNEYESCSNIEINARNETNVTLKCFSRDSCTLSIINIFNSWLQLQCNSDDSCQAIDIIINQPLQNTLNLSCNTNKSCDNLQIEILNNLNLNLNWFNIPIFTDKLNILIFCNNNNNIMNTSLFYSDILESIQCSDNNICCPSNYPFIPKTTFYSTIENTVIFISTQQDELNNLFLFQYFKQYIVALFWISFIYTIFVFLWSFIYFICNTFRAWRKCKIITHSNKINKSSMTTVCKAASCWNKCGYFMDLLQIITDFVLFISIFSHTIYAFDQYLWFIAGYISIGATLFNVFFFLLKFKILTRFYRYILLWRIKILLQYTTLNELKRQTAENNAKSNNIQILTENQRYKKWKIIENKNNKISLFLKYLIMFDLFSASLCDSLQSIVILYILTDLNKGDTVNKTIDSDYNALLLNKEWNEWQYFEWLLRIKLIICFLFMFYKLFNAMSVECNCCHSEKIKNKKKIKPNKGYIDSDTDYDDDDDDDDDGMMEEIMDGNNNKNYYSINDDTDYDYDSNDNRDKKQMIGDMNNGEIELQSMNINRKQMKNEENDDNDDNDDEYDDDLKRNELNDDNDNLPKEWNKRYTNDGKIYYQNEKKKQWEKPTNNDNDDDDDDDNDNNLEKDVLNVFDDMNKTKKYLGDPLGAEFEELWKKNIVGLIDENQEKLRNEAIKPVMLDIVDSIFDDINDGNGAQQFLKAVEIMSTFNNDDDDIKGEKEDKEEDEEDTFDSNYQPDPVVAVLIEENKKLEKDLDIESQIKLNNATKNISGMVMNESLEININNKHNDDDDDDDDGDDDILLNDDDLLSDDDDDDDDMNEVGMVYMNNFNNRNNFDDTELEEHQMIEHIVHNQLDNTSSDKKEAIPIYAVSVNGPEQIYDNDVMKNIVTRKSGGPKSQILFGFASNKESDIFEIDNRLDTDKKIIIDDMEQIYEHHEIDEIDEIVINEQDEEEKKMEIHDDGDNDDDNDDDDDDDENEDEEQLINNSTNNNNGGWSGNYRIKIEEFTPSAQKTPSFPYTPDNNNNNHNNNNNNNNNLENGGYHGLHQNSESCELAD